MTDLVQRLRREWMATQAASPKQLWVMVEKAQWMECTALTREAADAIALLTAERDEIQRELRKAETESSMLRVECGVIAKERDEARRMYCEHGTYTHPRQLAKELRWDCYKEDGK